MAATFSSEKHKDEHRQFVESFNTGSVCHMDGLNFMVPAGVYKPISGSSTEFIWKALRSQMALRPPQKTVTGQFRVQHFLEIGTGSGAISILLRKYYPWTRVTATDISERACATAECNALLYGVPIQVAQGDLWEPIKHSGITYDGVIFNVPLMDKPLDHPHELALCDPDGDLLYRFLNGIKDYVNPHGFALFLHATFSAPLPPLSGHIEVLQEINRPEGNVLRAMLWRHQI